MAEKDLFEGRRKASEEEYFRKREQQVIEKMRRRADEEATRRRMAERTGVADEEILQGLQDLGYTSETVMLLHLVPLVQVAWAEGNVSQSERDLILQAARARGIDEGSAADVQLKEWLTRRPTEELFNTTLRAIGAMLQALPDAEREATERDLLSYSSAIASASGGVLGFGKVSEQERELLARISAELERNHAQAAKRVLPSS